MVKRDRLDDKDEVIRALIARVEKLERAANTGFTSITRGGLRVASAEGLTVQAVAGGVAMRVTGVEVVDGTLRVTGTFDLDGTAQFDGTVVITGPLTINGATGITGNVDLTGNLNVVSSGRVKVGGMTLDPAANGGSIDFGSGRTIYAGSGTIGVYGAGGFFVINPSGIAMVHTNGRSVSVNTTGPNMNLPTINRTTIGSPPVGTVYADSGGQLYRAV